MLQLLHAMKLQTNRLRLRPWRDDDLARLFAMNSEPDVNVWLGGPALADRSTSALKLIQKHFEEHGWGILLVEDLAGRFLGLTGLQPVRSNLSIAPATEIVWRFRTAAWGNGYASEAATAILTNSASYGAPEDIVSIVAAENTRSARTAERVGFRRAPALDFLHPDLHDDNRLRPHHVFVSPQFEQR
jgi:RimJ/RimL family protein N-acetyltransferase